MDLVEIREGDALETLGRRSAEIIDLVLLDGAKALYRRDPRVWWRAACVPAR